MQSEHNRFTMRPGRPAWRQPFFLNPRPKDAPPFCLLNSVFCLPQTQPKAALPVARDEPRTEQGEQNPRSRPGNEDRPPRWRATTTRPGRPATLALALTLLAAGCSVTAPVDLAAARALDTLATELDRAFIEYHDELDTADARRQEAAMNAFVARIQSDHADPDLSAGHVQDFKAALAKLQSNARVELSRHSACRSNVDQVRSLAQGLRSIAVRSMTLNDEAQRLFDRFESTTVQTTPTTTKDE